MKQISLFFVPLFIFSNLVSEDRHEVNIHLSTNKFTEYVKPISKITLGLLSEFSHLCLLAAATNKIKFSDALRTIWYTLKNPKPDQPFSERLFISSLTFPPFIVNGLLVSEGCKDLYQLIKHDITIQKVKSTDSN